MGLAQSLRAVVGQLSGAHDDYHDYDDDDAFAGPLEVETDDESLLPPRQAGQRATRPLALVRPPRLEFSLVTPQDFDDAQQIAARLRAGGPVIVDLQSCGRDLSKRLIDFCSGLSYALEGSLHFVGETVVLLLPHDLELSSEAPGGACERRFFNQA